jgi:signal transduction histidine kinase
MGWITHRALTLEVAEAKARAEATRQEAVRLALWRMDSWMTSLIAREAARPYFHYLPFYPADRPYSFFSSESPLDVLNVAEPVSASPLLTTPPPDVKLYFQVWPDGHLTSPQVPDGGLRGLALLADASTANIDAAAVSLEDLSRILLSAESRQALGTNMPGLPSPADSSFRRWAENALSNRAPDPTFLPPASTGATVQLQGRTAADLTNLQTQRSSTGNATSSEARPASATNAQVETDGRQTWQTANDYQVRQQLADATRNISQNRTSIPGSNSANVSPAASVASRSEESPARNATPSQSATEPATGDKLEAAKPQSGAPIASKDQQKRSADSYGTGTEATDKVTAGDGTRRQDQASPNGPAFDRDATGAGLQDKEKHLTPSQPDAVSANGSSALDASAAGDVARSQLRGRSIDSFPVVVRSLAVEPTPLVTACVESPIALQTAMPHAQVATSFNLFLTRQVPLESGRIVQGMWLDWPMLRSSLLSLSKELVPGATLELCAPLPPDAAASDAGLMLASIPARLVLPADASAPVSMISLLTGDTWSPTRIAIVGGWLAVLAGILAIGWVLRQSVQLSERRGRFVSAVTHELRTPLTTFALYSQMLADGMVQDPESQREYHQTLRKESDRLSRIVESVLDYARLGKRRGDANGQVVREPIHADDLLVALEPHLRSRASVAGLALVVDAPDLAGVMLRAERDSIERILENLVENAGKYAAGFGSDPRLHLSARFDRGWLTMEVADHGPGISPGETRRIFAPFERGKGQQDGSKPGLGLGLAFARGLARDLGGDLVLMPRRDGFGAVFALRLPAQKNLATSQIAPDFVAASQDEQKSGDSGNRSGLE